MKEQRELVGSVDDDHSPIDRRLAVSSGRTAEEDRSQKWLTSLLSEEADWIKRWEERGSSL